MKVPHSKIKKGVKMYYISRAINGISINGDEYLLDDNNEIMLFESKKEALNFIGATNEEELHENFISINKKDGFEYLFSN